MNDRPPPHDCELENAYLSCILLEPEIVRSDVKPDDFYSRTNRLIYEVMLRLIGKGIKPDYITIKSEFEKNGDLEVIDGGKYISMLTTFIPSTANIEYYVHGIIDNSKRRSMLRISSTIANNAFDSTSDLHEVLKEAIGELTALGTV